jgi:hypothetical protein
MGARVWRCVAAAGVVVVAAGCTAVRVTPGADLVDGQQVTVTGSGYSPGSPVGVIECVAPADSIDDCASPTARSFSADGQGSFRLGYDVTRILEFGNGVEHDCAVPGSCFLVSVYLHGFQGRAATPLQFRPGPAVSAWPDTALADGQQVQVKGYGYGAGASLGILQCPAGATAPDQCDGRTAQSFSAGADGGFTRQLTVYATLEDAHGVVTDCSAAGRCEVVSVSIHGFQEKASDALDFGT